MGAECVNRRTPWRAAGMIRAMGDKTTAPWVYDRVTKWWVDLSQGTAGLEPGEAGGRYVCRACRESLVLRSIRPGAVNRPHFSHRRGTDCSAAPAVRAELELDDRIVIEFQQRIARAWLGAHCVLEFPEGLGNDGGGEGPSGVLPAAVVVGGGPDGQGPLVVERPRRPVGVGEVQKRIRTVRARYGAGARHVWFWAADAAVGRLADLQVAPQGRGGPLVDHMTIAPTAQQLAVIAAGGGVYFLDGATVLVPYGVHDFTHQPGPGEDWDFTGGRRNWRHDWRISHPVPAPDASRWGLAPTSFDELTRTRGVFTLTAVRELMRTLERVQTGRWNARRRAAAALYQDRHQLPLPTAVIPVLTPRPEPLASPLTTRQVEPVPVPAEHHYAPPASTAPATDTASPASRTAPTIPAMQPDPEEAHPVERVGSDDDYLLVPPAPAGSPVRPTRFPPRPAYPPTVHLPGHRAHQAPPDSDHRG